MNEHGTENEDRPTLVAEMQPDLLPDDGAARVFDCWNTIGVEGNKSCRELVKFIHCRNCPVFSSAGMQLLDRPITAEYRQEWTAHFSQQKKLSTPARSSAVVFRIADEWLALPTQAFQEIAEKRVMHSLPHRRRGVVLGLVNVRGELLICASLGKLLGLTQDLPREKARVVFDRLLVGSWNGERFAFPVDEVGGIHRFNRDDLREPPATVGRSSLSHTRGVFNWRARTIGFLDADSIFNAVNRNLS